MSQCQQKHQPIVEGALVKTAREDIVYIKSVLSILVEAVAAPRVSAALVLKILSAQNVPSVTDIIGSVLITLSTVAAVVVLTIVTDSVVAVVAVMSVIPLGEAEGLSDAAEFESPATVR